MADTAWTCTIDGTSFTSIMLSMNFNVGRTSYFDTWSGNSCQITVRNNSGQASNLNQGDIITIGNGLNGTTMTFYVVEVAFQDDIAVNGYTATITGRDALGQLYQAAANDDVIIGYTNAIEQCTELMTEIAPYYPPYPSPSPTTGRATVTDSFDQTTVGQRIGELLATENSSLWYDGQTLEFRASAAPGAALSAFTLNTSTGLVYSGIERKYPNANYPTNVRLTSTTNGTTEAAVTGVYRRNYDRNVLLTNATQQQAQTDWFASVLSQTADPYMDIRFNDTAQTTTKMSDWLSELPAVSGKYVNVTYRDPSAGNISRNMVVEGAAVSATPKRSEWTVFLSPAVVYELFTLNSSVFGILNTNRLGW